MTIVKKIKHINKQVSNRIVVNYGDFSDIILLAVINKYTGVDEWLSNDTKQFINSLGFKIVDEFPEFAHLSVSELQAMNLPNKEGFVLHYEDGFRVKVKFEDYCRLHAIITNISYRDIWETLRINKPIDEILENVPDEFDAWVKNKISILKNSFNIIDMEIKASHANVLNNLPKRYTKKMFALKNISLNKDSFLRGCVFALEDKKDYTDTIWLKLYPPFEKPFNKVEDDVE